MKGDFEKEREGYSCDGLNYNCLVYAGIATRSSTYFLLYKYGKTILQTVFIVTVGENKNLARV